MWDLPGSGIETVSSALAGRLKNCASVRLGELVRALLGLISRALLYYVPGIAVGTLNGVRRSQSAGLSLYLGH